MAVMGDALRERLSDAGSIPARSIRDEYVLMKRRACPFLFISLTAGLKEDPPYAVAREVLR